MTDVLLTATPAPSFDDPLGMLHACHRRIERHLGTLIRLQRYLSEHGCDGDARLAARNLLRYFDSAAPNHHADEEASVFPRLAQLQTAEVEELLAALANDHEAINSSWRKLRPLIVAIAAGQRANLPPKVVADAAAAYEAHIEQEENDLLPLAERTFDPATIAAIGREMAERRAVDASSVRQP